jgi:hypothetical protein
VIAIAGVIQFSITNTNMINIIAHKYEDSIIVENGSIQKRLTIILDDGTSYYPQTRKEFDSLKIGDEVESWTTKSVFLPFLKSTKVKVSKNK